MGGWCEGRCQEAGEEKLEECCEKHGQLAEASKEVLVSKLAVVPMVMMMMIIIIIIILRIYNINICSAINVLCDEILEGLVHCKNSITFLKSSSSHDRYELKCGYVFRS